VIVRRRSLWGVALAMIALAISAAIAVRAIAASAAAANPPRVDLITIDGSINPAVASYVEDSINYAAESGAAAIVIEIDTPGGLLTSAEKIVEAILGAPVPVIVYVSPSGASAASAGTFITEAASVAAMAPGTTIGAAHPVEEGGEEVKGVMGEKLENFAASWARTIAEQRGRNQDWMEEAVRHSASIGESEALSKHVIDLVAPDLRSLLKQAAGRTVKVNGREVTLLLADATVQRVVMSFGQRVLNTLSDPNIVYLLLMAGIVGLYFEFAHPGVVFPGVAGAICLLLALASFEVLPINLAGLLLIFLGIGLLAAEAFVSSYGILGVGGVISFVLGSLFLIDTSKTNLEVNRGMIAGAAVALSAIIIGLGYVVARERRRRAVTGPEGLIGEVGEVREAIIPGTPGKVFVHGEIWRASSLDPIATGARAEITAIRGLELEVRRLSH
jgi:membrane-bound serine protease (ClpP class)